MDGKVDVLEGMDGRVGGFKDEVEAARLDHRRAGCGARLGVVRHGLGFDLFPGP